ncbi:hypothetical protein ACODT4_44580 [Streptomyces sp. 2.9]|uniref:hypothetical protein n=1 Tax=Streptomyces tritrimontium TaxID=3406573 RepID=UPI003BB650E1
MTSSTPRLDSLTAGGTDDIFDGIRLADGHVLTLNTHPGADVAQGVFLYPGLTAPDAEAWGEGDDLEGWLTGGDFSDGMLHSDVPIEAVRALILAHGGEHQNQEPTPSAETEETSGAEGQEHLRFPDLMAYIAELHGRFANGYSAEDIRTVFGRIHELRGPYLVCVWEYADKNGFGGTAQFYAEGWYGDLSEVRPDIHQWLSGNQETPGPVATWVGAAVTEPTDFPVSDDFHNYARTDRTE